MRRDDGTGLIDLDPWLEPYRDRLRERHARYRAARARFDASGGLLGEISQGYRYFGLNRGERGGVPGVWYREWAPAAAQLSLVGDFNGWDRAADPLERDEYGVWSRFLPDAEYAGRLVHESRVKVHVASAAGPMDRIPAYIRRVVQDRRTLEFSGQYWAPPVPYAFRHPAPTLHHGLRIYDSKVVMAHVE
jgi:1,4-alpha-glucan branching enzyme